MSPSTFAVLALEEAAATWRALPEENRAAMVKAMEHDRERLDEESSNYVLPQDIEHRKAVLATCDAVLALCRAASVEPVETAATPAGTVTICPGSGTYPTDAPYGMLADTGRCGVCGNMAPVQHSTAGQHLAIHPLWTFHPSENP